MVTSKQIKAVMNGYLRSLPGWIDRCENHEDQEMEIKFMESLSGSLSLFEWLNRFSENYSAENHIVCLWIIKQGYITAVVDVLCEYEKGIADNEILLSHPSVIEEERELLRSAIKELDNPYHSILHFKCAKDSSGYITICNGKYKLVKGILSEIL